MLTTNTIWDALRGFRTAEPRASHPRDAAVGLILAGPPATPSVCLIRRADRDSDRWSGQMALPGGRVEPTDVTLRATAEREVHEEVGLNLTDAERFGALPSVAIHRRGTVTGATLTAFVYYTGLEHRSLQPEPGEVAEAMWVDLAALWAPENATTIARPTEARPGITVGNEVVWGLTWRVLASFGRAVGAPLPTPRPSPPRDELSIGT